MKVFVVALAVLPCLHALTINTPSGVTECEPQLISWSNGTAPYYIAVIPGGDSSATALKSFDTTSATSLTWTVDIASGTSISLRAKDSTGTIAYSDAVTIASGTDSSCLSSSSTISASFGTTDSSSTATADSDDTDSSTTSTGTVSSSSSSSTDNAATSLSALPYAGIVGAVIAALFQL